MHQPPFRFKKFQREDYARAALHEGVILGHDTGGGKSLALFVWPALKAGFESASATARPGLQPLAPALLVVPGDLHNQTIEEGAKHFRATVNPLDTQAKFLRLSCPNPRTGVRELPAGYYITSYTQLSGNGVIPIPAFDPTNIQGMIDLLHLSEADCETFFAERVGRYQRHYQRLCATADDNSDELRQKWESARCDYDDANFKREIDESYHILRHFVTSQRFSKYRDLSVEQKEFVRNAMVEARYREYASNIGECKHYRHQQQTFKVKCVYSPSLADLCQDSFAVTAVDEGVKMKGEETIIGRGARQMNSRYKLVLTATPIKNRLPDVFRLVWWATGARAEAHARFPYPDSSGSRDDFAEEFLVSEHNLTKEENSNRRYRKLTPQVCNIHRLWKLFAPIILRRRKKDFGEDIVQKRRHVVRVPMGKEQAAVYKFHLEAKYRDVNGRAAIGGQLQALRIAAANPTSHLLVRPEGDGKTRGSPRSDFSHIPKLVSCLKLIQQILERGEQVVVFSAFRDSLDVLSARLSESGVNHCVLDGRMSPKKRGAVAAQFKLGPPRAGERVFSKYPVMLAGVECMAEGHSFNLCNNVILMCYSWAYDKFEQAINRVHRINSRWDVNIYSIICEGSIDRKLEALMQEKGDAAELVLDGHLLGEHPSEVNLAELLHIAQREFNSTNVIDERQLDSEWRSLRVQLARAAQAWIGIEPETQKKDVPLIPPILTTSLWRWRLSVSRQQSHSLT